MIGEQSRPIRCDNESGKEFQSREDLVVREEKIYPNMSEKRIIDQVEEALDQFNRVRQVTIDGYSTCSSSFF